MKKWEKFTREELENLVAESTSYRDLAKKCGYSVDSGSSHAAVKEMVSVYQFTTDHFVGQGWNKDNFDYSRFKYGSVIKTGNALPAITSLRGYKCEVCGNFEWNGCPIALEIHHIDGDSLNNNLDNLQLQCPNCHAQTENYRGRNINQKALVSEENFVLALRENLNIRQALLSLGLSAKGGNYVRARELIHKYNIVHLFEKKQVEYQIIQEKTIKEPNLCIDCQIQISDNAVRCVNCNTSIQRKVDRPNRDELKQEIRNLPFLQLGRKYGVCDNSIRKWCKSYSLPSTKRDILHYTDDEWKNI